jgi:hypothetical protein
MKHRAPSFCRFGKRQLVVLGAVAAGIAGFTSVAYAIKPLPVPVVPSIPDSPFPQMPDTGQPLPVPVVPPIPDTPFPQTLTLNSYNQLTAGEILNSFAPWKVIQGLLMPLASVLMGKSSLVGVAVMTARLNCGW